MKLGGKLHCKMNRVLKKTAGPLPLPLPQGDLECTPSFPTYTHNYKISGLPITFQSLLGPKWKCWHFGELKLIESRLELISTSVSFVEWVFSAYF